MKYKLIDKQGRELGYVLSTWQLENGLGGRFEPGPDFIEVQPIFDEYASYIDGNECSANSTLHQRLSELEPKLVSLEDNSIIEYYSVVVTEVPSGHNITLVERRV